ncbi:MAG: hypothetical protein N3B21_18485 [Clostridia bacterium]|nr:hypothetical protein [Clostridia bacterium]
MISKIFLPKSIKVFFLASCSLLIVSVLSNTAFAASTQYKTYNTASITQTSSYEGFWMRGTLPTLNPNWKSGAENKINYEFWYNINDTGWVEMGYHNGYAWKDNGYPEPTSSYSGCFTCISSSTYGWKVDIFPGLNWAPGQTHTLGAIQEFSTSAWRWNTKMSSDGTVLTTYLNAGPASRGTIDAGLEWGVSDGASQSISLPSWISDLNLYKFNKWITWSSIGGVSYNNSHSGVTSSFDSSANKINFR